jgi:hypothetical protein
VVLVVVVVVLGVVVVVVLGVVVVVDAIVVVTAVVLGGEVVLVGGAADTGGMWMIRPVFKMLLDEGQVDEVALAHANFAPVVRILTAMMSKLSPASTV